jgi:CelD/BcsL family acetyltransferase involved in cellulose biosynthesis
VSIRVPVVHTAAGWDDYWASRSRNLRHNVERCTRRAREAGALTFEMHEAFPDGALERLLDEGFVVEASGWKGAQGTAILASDETRAYYTGLARWAASEGWLRLGFVRVDGDPIAFCLGIQAFGVHYALKVGYAEHARRLSPGVLLFHSLIRRAFDDGLHTFDFAGHDQPYKSAWATGIDEYIGLSSFSRSPAGGAALAAARLRRRLAASPLRPALERARTTLGGLRGGPPTPAIPVHGTADVPTTEHTNATHEADPPDPQGRTPAASGPTPPRVESTG